jgi:hypothetical protein
MMMHDQPPLRIHQQVMGQTRQGRVASQFDREVPIARARGKNFDDDERLGDQEPIGHPRAADDHVGLEGRVRVDFDLRPGDEHLAVVAPWANAAVST